MTPPAIRGVDVAERATAPRPGTTDQTLADLLRTRMREDADRVAYEFVNLGGEVVAITYGELGRRSLATAAAMAATGAVADRAPALIVYPPGIDFLVALWACLISGVPAVPTHPASRGTRTRIEGITADAQARWVLAPAGAAPEVAGATVVEVAPAEPGDRPAPEPGYRPALDDVAVVQYTSGSTRAPKGVVLSHRNLVHNIERIAELFAVDHASRGFIWLPPYHDMGLIGGILIPVFVGFPMCLSSPLQFLKNPMFWLEQVSAVGADVSGGPNFAYDLAVRQQRGDLDPGLDLSRWRVAFNGAEPVRHATLTAFAERFAPAGFRREAFLPCYGLAEATLLVTGAHWLPSADERVRCGTPVPHHRVAIVDPETGVALPEGAEGEIWVHGPSVSPGYWRGPDGAPATDALGHLAGEPYLRTGDLGLLTADGLVVRGRLKDVLIVRGVNYHAADIESLATADNPEVRPVAAAFAVEGETATRTVLLVERVRRIDDPAATAADLRARVLDGLGLRIDTVLVAPPRTIPRTSSGKVQRSLCRQRFLAGEYREWEGTTPEEPPAGDPAGDPGGADLPDQLDLVGILAGVFAGVCEADGCGPDDGLVEIGGDSLRAAEIAGILEHATGLPTPVEAVVLAGTPRRLAALLREEWPAHGVTEQAVLERFRALTEQEETTP